MPRINKLKPNPEAEGDHTSFIENFFGKIIRYATYIKNIFNPSGFDEIKRVDLIGQNHYNKATGDFVGTPHVHEKNIPGEIRKANEDEIPGRNKN
ncbi:MAG: hypothetical protein KDK36_07435 [Leptospiraceae bacterium]|nr:hypothetical protein [Leptospiraceae bacterium]